MLIKNYPSYIITLIEYWYNEKRKFTQCQRFIVLLAASFDRRYFNIVKLLSLNIPITAVRVDLLKANGEYILNFTKILNVFVEPKYNEVITTIKELSQADKSKQTLK